MTATPRRHTTAPPLAAIALIAVLAVPSCASQPTDPPPRYGPDYAYGRCADCGVIEGISLQQPQADDRVGAGTVLGGIAGAVIGNQFGGGRGNTAATIAGAAGGAYAGHQLEKRPAGQALYRVSVRLDNGAHADVMQAYDPRMPVGAPVRIVGDHVEPR